LRFNPVSKLFSKEVSENYKFKTNTKLTGNKNKPEYSKLLVKLSFIILFLINFKLKQSK